MATKRKMKDEEASHIVKKVPEIHNEPTDSGSSTATHTSCDEASLQTKHEAEGIEINIYDEDDSDEDESQDREEICLSDIPDHIECSSMNNNNNKTILKLGVKSYLVHYDYILYPYSVEIDNGESKKRQKLEDSRVSHIISRSSKDESYTLMKNRIQELKALNHDTSKRRDLMELRRNLKAHPKSMRYGVSSNECIKFMSALCHILQMEKSKQEEKSKKKKGRDEIKMELNREENVYRNLFRYFLEIVIIGQVYLVQEEPECRRNTISFPLWNTEKTVSGIPHMRIYDTAKYPGATLALIQCRKYCEMEIRFRNKPVRNDEELRKDLRGKVTFEEEERCVDGEGNHDDWYRDIDARICRHINSKEKKSFTNLLGKTVGEILAWFDTYDDGDGIEVVRHAIVQIGFKIIFMTVGVNSSSVVNKDSAHIVVCGNEGMGIDVFLTRPFDMMRVDDRDKIVDILYALMKSKL